MCENCILRLQGKCDYHEQSGECTPKLEQEALQEFKEDLGVFGKALLEPKYFLGTLG